MKDDKVIQFRRIWNQVENKRIEGHECCGLPTSALKALRLGSHTADRKGIILDDSQWDNE